MANFCKFCGSPLENGVCTCEAAQQANVAAAPQATPQPAPQATPQPAPQPAPQAPYQQAPYQQAPQGYQQMPYQPAAPAQPNPTVEKIKKVLIDCKNLLIATLKAPVQTMRTTDVNADKAPALVMGGLHVFLMFLLTWISFLGLNDYLDGGVRAKIGLGLAAIAVVGVLFATLGSFLFGKKYDPTMNFVRALANICVATIPGTLIFVLYFIFGLFAPGIALVLLIACFLVWVVFSQEAVTVNMKGAPIAPWINIAAVVISMILIFLVGKSMIMDAISGLLGGLGSFF